MLIFVFWPVNVLVEACPPVFEYTCVSSTKHLTGMPEANIRDNDWKPMSKNAPSPPMHHSGLPRPPLSSPPPPRPRPPPAPRPGAGPANVHVRLLLEHHINQ